MEERSEVREEGTKSAVRDGVVPGRPPPPPPGFGGETRLCVSPSLSCAGPHCACLCTPRVGVLRALSVTPRPRRWRPLPYISLSRVPFMPFLLVMILCCVTNDN